MEYRISDLMNGYRDGDIDLEDCHITTAGRINELTMERLGPRANGAKPRRRGRKLGRTLLIAAAIAAALAVTAAAVYQYSLRDAVMEDMPDTDYAPWKTEDTKSEVSLNGFAGSPEYQAYVEWESWNRVWREENPDWFNENGVDDSYFEGPESYAGFYAAYAREQVEKLDEILDKYGLTAHEKRFPFDTEEQLCRALGLEEDIFPDGIDIEGDYLYDDGTFKAAGTTVIDGVQEWVTCVCAVEGSFTDYSLRMPDGGEWSYVTASGTEVILAESETYDRMLIIAGLEGCYVTVTVDAAGREQAQAIADGINFPALERLFATETARKAAAASVADFDENRASYTTVGNEEEAVQAAIAFLGDWYPAELPEGAYLTGVTANLPGDAFGDYYSVQRDYNGVLSLFYRELEPEDGENGESRLELASYIWDDEPQTACTVGGCEASLAALSEDILALWWLDTDRQLVFRMGTSGLAREEILALAEDVTGTAPASPPVREPTTPAERFAARVRPLSEIVFHNFVMPQERIEVKTLVDELGNYGLPEARTGAALHLWGQTDTVYDRYWQGPASFHTVGKEYAGCGLTYRRFPAEENSRADATETAFEMEKKELEEFQGPAITYEITDCTVNGWDGYITASFIWGEQDKIAVNWYDGDRDLWFAVEESDPPYMSGEELISLAEQVAETAWDTSFRDLVDDAWADSVLSELGDYTLAAPGLSRGSLTLVGEYSGDTGVPAWYVDGGECVYSEASFTWLEDLALIYERYWEDGTKAVVSNASAFADMKALLLACDDGGGVTDGLRVGQYDAFCVEYPSDPEQLWYTDTARTELTWYDTRRQLIFTLVDYPGEDGVSRSAAELIELAESVTEAER